MIKKIKKYCYHMGGSSIYYHIVLEGQQIEIIGKGEYIDRIKTICGKELSNISSKEGPVGNYIFCTNKRPYYLDICPKCLNKLIDRYFTC